MMIHPDYYSDVGDKGGIMNQKSLSVLGTSAGEAFKIILLQIAEAIFTYTPLIIGSGKSP